MRRAVLYARRAIRGTRRVGDHEADGCHLQDGAKGAAEDIGGLAGREADGLPDPEGEAQGVEAKAQDLFYPAAQIPRLAFALQA